MTPNRRYNLYIASCAKDGGILHYQMDTDGTLSQINIYPCDRPMYLASYENTLFAVLRAPFDDVTFSGLVSFDIQTDGSLARATSPISTMGDVGCHVLCDKGDVYVTNYISGSVIKMPNTLITHSGHGVNLPRQNAPHTHCAAVTPDDNYIAVTDLGLDEIALYDRDMHLKSKAFVPQGHGARHIVFTGNMCFCANELLSTVSAFTYENGTLSLTDTAPTLFADTSENYPAAIRYDVPYIYVSNRGNDSISVFTYSGNKLHLESVIGSHGAYPRDINIVGEYLIAVNEIGNSLAVFRREKNSLIFLQSYPAKSPVSALALPVISEEL